LTVKSIPDLLKVIKRYRKINPKISTHFSMVTEREWMHPNSFGKTFWSKDVEKILEELPNDNYRDQIAKQYMQGTFSQIPEERNTKNIKMLKFFLDQLDKRRNTKWREVYPYLDI